MIYKFGFENFYSFKDETTIDFTLNNHTPLNNLSYTTPLNKYLTKILCVIGPNASGKTHLLEALPFIINFACHSFHDTSHDDFIYGVTAHYLHKEKPTNFFAEFEMEKKIYRYELSTDIIKVIKERLQIKEGRVWKNIFSRIWRPEEQEYKLILEEPFSLNLTEAKKVRKNASLISTAAQYNVEFAVQLIFYLNNVFQKQTGFQNLQFSSDFFKNNNEHLEHTIKLLQDFDPSLSGIKFEEDKQELPSGRTRIRYTPYGIHNIGEDRSVDVIIYDEAGGTVAAFAMLPVILRSLTTGGIAVIDELEENLHPLMLESILNLFISPDTNPRNATLLFTCHAPHILNILDKSRIILVEKCDRHYSEAWRLDDMKGIRRSDNLAAKYLAGAYGGIPKV